MPQVLPDRARTTPDALRGGRAHMRRAGELAAHQQVRASAGGDLVHEEVDDEEGLHDDEDHLHKARHELLWLGGLAGRRAGPA
jgi:hypothetical protein